MNAYRAVFRILLILAMALGKSSPNLCVNCLQVELLITTLPGAPPVFGNQMQVIPYIGSQKFLIGVFAEDGLPGLADTVLFDQDGSHQPDQRSFVREDPDNAGAPLQFPVQPLDVV